MPTWTTPRLVLTPSDPGLAPAVADYLRESREFHAPWEPVHADDWFATAQVAERLTTEVAEARAGRQLVVYLSRPEAPGRVIGRIALNNVVRGALQGCSVGYALSRDATGEGLMTEALSRMVEVAFGELGLHRVEVNVVTRNVASAAVAERCGFSVEGVSPKFLLINGVWEDHVRYVRVNDAWEAS